MQVTVYEYSGRNRRRTPFQLGAEEDGNMGFVEKGEKTSFSKLRAAGKTEKEVSEIIEQAAEAATVFEKDGISGASGENQGSRRRKPARCSFESGNQCKRGIDRI